MRKPPVKVLVVDPDEGVQALLQEILERSGHSVSVALNGQEAQKAIIGEGGDFDLVITSHELSLLNGVELVRWIRERHPSIKTILMEDHAKEEICEAARLAGADEVLEKPADFNLLAPIIRKMLGETRSPLKILVVDDTESMRLLLTDALTHDGHSVSVAMNGQEALKMLSQDPKGFHLVITDYEMEPIHGLELTRRIKEEYPHVKVIFMTGFGGEIFSAALASGACGTLRKPFSPDSLAAAVEKACAGQAK